ncbi:MAG TPA: SIR2 family protein [Blastocatellia bacterium]|nr:SIR2 family protein [Blastocatellia bacterium]
MEHILKLEGEGLRILHESIFPKIASGETILFLGAGASVTDKTFLGEEIIDLYSSRKGIEKYTTNLIEFVDTQSADPSFDRDDFDDFVVQLLSKLNVSETHRIIASANWKEIITTNYDLLIEKAFDLARGTTAETLSLKVVHTPSEYYYTQANDEVKYIKLNGCISDKKAYPLVFSTDDFNKSARFYRTVLRSLMDLSPKVNFLSVGYSYSDILSKALRQRFDKYNVKKRWILNVDPFVRDAQLAYFREERISVIRATAAEFFAEYKKWDDLNHENIVNRRKIRFTNNNNERLKIPGKLAVRLANNLIQLSEDSPSPVITASNFYKGEEPTFDVIRKNYDVVKSSLLSIAKAKIHSVDSESRSLIPILFLVGSFGIGKTTFCYRVINELLHDEEFKALSFEVYEADKLKAEDLGEVFRQSKANHIILFFNGIEVDSAYKSLMEFRTRLSIEQFPDFKILILASIRENILERHTLNKKYPAISTLKIDVPFTPEEASDLVENLNKSGLLHYRDAKQKNALVSKIVNEYQGDTLISLIGLVSDSHHFTILRDVYSQLTQIAQEAFLFTALLYRFNLLIPSSLLMSVTSRTWEDFDKDILKYDGKGILIQETKDAKGAEPDLYFRIRHPLIADKLVEIYLPSEDMRFEKYLYLLRHIIASRHNSTLVINLLHALRDYEDLAQEKINKLYDECSQDFPDDPHFNLHYAINLQHRGDKESLVKGIDRITQAEAFLERRSHRLIHRRAVLNFRLAQRVFKEEVELRETFRYIHEARALFEIKQILDPFSHYSYVEFIRFEIWYLESVLNDAADQLRQMIVVEQLFDKAEKSVFENAHLISDLKKDYYRLIDRSPESDKEYLNYLNGLYKQDSLKPSALILKYYYFSSLNDSDACSSIVGELEKYKYIDQVSNLLFKHYGRSLYRVENRINLFNIIKVNPKIEREDPVRYHYYLYIAEAYNRNFRNSYEHITELRRRFYNLNPLLEERWIDAETGVPKKFEAIIQTKKKRKKIKVFDLQQLVDLKPSNSNIELLENSQHQVILHFQLSGIRAEIID